MNFPILENINRFVGQQARAGVRSFETIAGRTRLLAPGGTRFVGAFGSCEEAIASPLSGRLVGFDHEEVADVAFDLMCRVTLWDYPVLFWLQRLLPNVTNIVDAGGHMGTKFFAFREMLMLQDRVEWIVYDLPAIVRAGRARAEREGVPGLRFIDRLEDAPPSHLFLASGLLQYLDVPFPQLLARLPARPRHMIINKVALREGPTVVTLERHGDARVTYQIRNQNTFMSEISELGYRVVDHWTIPILSHVIPTHPELGASQSKGFCLELTN